jgi:adenine/guanine phosphoribosyltransferase-like PRPP-binding protein
LHFYDFASGDRVAIIDDTISTGATLEGVLTVLRDLDVLVRGVHVICARNAQYSLLGDRFDVPIIPLVVEK